MPDELIYRHILQRDLIGPRGLPVSGETMRRYIRDGVLPRPDVMVSRQVMAWRRSTLLAHGINLPPRTDPASPPTPEASDDARQ